jgi:NAD(P)-dependent dehydrogenase (short-subunit alcohol dehydrogenase family)
MTTGRLSGRVALVTGAAGGGTGGAVVENFLAEGASVILVDIRADALAERVETLKAAGHRVAGAAASITDRAALRAAVEPAVAALGTIDTVVANANVGGKPTTFDKTSAQSFRDDVADNLSAQFNTIELAIEGMKQLRRGSIVIVGSVNGLTALGQPAYSAAKAGLVSLTQTLAVEYGPYGIRANIVCPATIQTPGWGPRLERRPGLLDSLARWYPLGRIAQPKDVAKAISFLASDDAAFISGITLPVDGGLLAGNGAMARDLTLEDQ